MRKSSHTGECLLVSSPECSGTNKKQIKTHEKTSSGIICAD